ncbi:ketopantoate reductase [Pseudooceanicola antarcticus]|uniref:2-dehydropantoate 2-reductase n=1 Tax=Pseudooceanicola antarcticus TaxID=1247613 RepID=A0A285JDV1_9RHOB|nr:2-dehydropantoate 2-reductase [Pseudooceanicola antarcticus]PJE30877.1 2-dehydropantoate 2-reductase [Pseudooceanicola antarcticus]SNY57576.1 ketopantoate reductase [Pseudooceanicola antarcticus]
MTAPLPPLPEGPLSVCVVGAGAIGGTIAAHLAGAGPEAGLGEVSVVARGAHLQAIQAQGLRLQTPEGLQSYRVTATDDPGSLPPQDLVITALKGHQVPPMAEALSRLLAPHGRILPVVNGVPWWYPISDGQGGVKGAEEVDPGGVLWDKVGAARAIGCIAVMGASVPEPGLIDLGLPGYLDIGRLPGEDRADVARVAALLSAAGLKIRQTEPFQNALFSKLYANCGFNSVCALARAPMNRMLADPVLAELTAGIMAEVGEIAAAEHARLLEDPAQRIERARGGAAFKPSTLQDLEKGRPMEIEPIFGATLSVARSHAIEAPKLSLVTAMLRSIDREMGET